MQRKHGSSGTRLENSLELEPFQFSAKTESGRGSLGKLWMLRTLPFSLLLLLSLNSSRVETGLEETLEVPTPCRSPFYPGQIIQYFGVRDGSMEQYNCTTVQLINYQTIPFSLVSHMRAIFVPKQITWNCSIHRTFCTLLRLFNILKMNFRFLTHSSWRAVFGALPQPPPRLQWELSAGSVGTGWQGLSARWQWNPSQFVHQCISKDIASEHALCLSH